MERVVHDGRHSFACRAHVGAALVSRDRPPLHRRLLDRPRHPFGSCARGVARGALRPRRRSHERRPRLHTLDRVRAARSAAPRAHRPARGRGAMVSRELLVVRLAQVPGQRIDGAQVLPRRRDRRGALLRVARSVARPTQRGTVALARGSASLADTRAPRGRLRAAATRAGSALGPVARRDATPVRPLGPDRNPARAPPALHRRPRRLVPSAADQAPGVRRRPSRAAGGAREADPGLRVRGWRSHRSGALLAEHEDLECSGWALCAVRNRCPSGRAEPPRVRRRHPEPARSSSVPPSSRG